MDINSHVVLWTYPGNHLVTQLCMCDVISHRDQIILLGIHSNCIVPCMGCEFHAKTLTHSFEKTIDKLNKKKYTHLQGPLEYGERTPIILFRRLGSDVTSSFGPTRTRDPWNTVKILRNVVLPSKKILTVFVIRLFECRRLAALDQLSQAPISGKPCPEWPRNMA